MEAKSKAPNPASAPIVEANPDAARWDEVADVIVVGFGGAGAVAALEAHDRGASVLVLERFQGGGHPFVHAWHSTAAYLLPFLLRGRQVSPYHEQLTLQQFEGRQQFRVFAGGGANAE